FYEEAPAVASVYLHDVVAGGHVFPFAVTGPVYGRVRSKKLRRHEKAGVFRQICLTQVGRVLREVAGDGLDMETAVDRERRLDSKLHRFDVTGNDADLLPRRKRLRIRAGRCLKNIRSRTDPAQFKLAVRSYVVVRMDGIARLREQLHDRLLAGCEARN